MLKKLYKCGVFYRIGQLMHDHVRHVDKFYKNC